MDLSTATSGPAARDAAFGAIGRIPVVPRWLSMELSGLRNRPA
jgi:hypothetical protein